jgi:hypothetical protein
MGNGSRIPWQGYGALHPTCRSEFTRVRAGEEVQDHVDIVITDYETNRVMDGHIQSIAYRCFGDGNGTVQ